MRFAEGEPVSLDHLKRLTDDTGVIQHALGAIPNRKTGYTTDDNARALYVAVQAARGGDPSAERLAETYLAFLLYAQEPDGWFHNFFSYDRRPMPETPSEDCQGRSLWALAEAARYWEGRGHGRVAAQMFSAGLEAASRLQSPRGLAGLIIACTSWLEAPGPHREATGDLDITPRAEGLLEQAASRLAAAFAKGSGPGWYWCEDIVTYDNAMLPYALLRAAGFTAEHRWQATGLEALAFLSDATFPGERFSPVGNRGWYPRGGKPARYDQQALEATATVFACLEAHRLTGDGLWSQRAQRALRWFLGDNTLGVSLYDPTTGGCRDGLGPNGVNTNQGAESTIVWLMAAQAVPAWAKAA